MRRWRRTICLAVAFAALAAGAPHAAAVPSGFDGAALSPLWGLPFAGVLLSLALWPLFARAFWHHHYGKITAFWSVAFLLPFAAVFGADEALHQVAHALFAEYLPFVILLFALYTIAGGISLRGTLVGTPALNTGLIALGTALASIMGTTGAAMLLIRPLLRANESRRQKVHLVVFFIVLVGNVGGALSPLGDPPLFIGFLKGVDFFWTTRVLALPTLLLSVALLAIFFAIDVVLSRRERLHADSTERPAHSDARAPLVPHGRREPLAVDGALNFLLIAGVVAQVLLSGIWKPGISFDIAGAPLALQDLERDVGAARSRRPVDLAHAARSARSQRVQLGTHRRGGQAVRGDLSHRGPGDRDAAGRAPWCARRGGRAGHRRRRRAAVGDVLLDDRLPVGVPRQCADLPGVLQPGRRRRGDAHGAARRRRWP